MGKSTLVIVMGAIVIFALVSFNTSERISQATDNSVEYFSETISRNLTNSAVGALISDLADNQELRVKSPITKSYTDKEFTGTINYTIKDSTIAGDKLVEIALAGTYDDIESRVIAYVKLPKKGFVPGAVKAAVSTNNPIATLGTLIVDGQNYDINGVLIPNSGTKGIWTTQTYDQSGNSKVGGTYKGSDYIPSKPGSPDIIDTNATYPGGYPETPDGILGGSANGYPEGTLKSIAQSGVNGSQYVTDPSTLTHPLKGVTYVELPVGQVWLNADITGSGIMIVHNTAKNAQIKNLNAGTFKGLVIVDDVIHVHTNILGALIGLTPEPSRGNCLGNGAGVIRYSSEAISLATSSLSGSSSKFGYGYGKYRLEVVHWFEK